MREKYFVIIGSDDGGCTINEVTKEELTNKLTPNKFGETFWGVLGSDFRILGELPDDVCNFSGIVIIKGNIVLPKPKQTVTEYDIP